MGSDGWVGRTMRNPQNWQPSKYVFLRGKLVASRDRREVLVGSRLMADAVAAHFQSAIAQYAHGRLADLGCGKVPLYGAYRDYVSEVTCVDWAHSSHPSQHIDHACDLTEALPFPDGSFDTLIVSDVLEHIPNPEHFWMEMARILTPNGVLLLSVPFYYWLHEEPHDYYRYTEHALRRFADVSGFELLVLESLGGAPEILADILAKLLQPIPVLGHALAVAVQHAAAGLRKTPAGRRLSAATGKVFPFGYFLVARRR